MVDLIFFVFFYNEKMLSIFKNVKIMTFLLVKFALYNKKCSDIIKFKCTATVGLPYFHKLKTNVFRLPMSSMHI